MPEKHEQLANSSHHVGPRTQRRPSATALNVSGTIAEPEERKKRTAESTAKRTAQHTENSLRRYKLKRMGSSYTWRLVPTCRFGTCCMFPDFLFLEGGSTD